MSDDAKPRRGHRWILTVEEAAAGLRAYQESRPTGRSMVAHIAPSVNALAATFFGTFIANVPLQLYGGRDRVSVIMPAGDYLRFTPRRSDDRVSSGPEPETLYYNGVSVETLREFARDMMAFADSIETLLNPPPNYVTEERVHEPHCMHCHLLAQQSEDKLKGSK